MKTFLLYTTNILDTEFYIGKFKSFCKNKIDYRIYSFNDPIIKLMSEITQLKSNIVKSFITDERDISFRDGRVYIKFTNFRHMFDCLSSQFSNYDPSVLYKNFELCEGYNLITDLTTYKQYKNFESDDTFILNVSDFKFRVRNSKLINNLKDFEEILEIDNIINLGKFYEC